MIFTDFNVSETCAFTGHWNIASNPAISKYGWFCFKNKKAWSQSRERIHEVLQMHVNATCIFSLSPESFLMKNSNLAGLLTHSLFKAFPIYINSGM